MKILSINSVGSLLFWAALVLTAFLGMSDFHTRGEAREALVVKSIFETGDHVLPVAYGGAVPSKPPFFHWVGACVSRIAGEVSEFSVRLPSALFSLLTLVFFTSILRNTLSPIVCALFITILTFSFEWLRASVSARVDMVHASTLSCALLSSFVFIERRSMKWWLGFVVFLVGAILSKGPVALALILLIGTVWKIDRDSSLRPSREDIWLVCGALLSALIAVSWYYAAYLRSPAEFFARVWYENVSRFSGAMDDIPHNHFPPYLLLMFILGFLPWTPVALPAAIKSIRENGMSPKRSIERFAVVCVATITLFYCIPASKRGVYLLAAYPFAALLAAVWIERAYNWDWKVVRRCFVAGALMVALVQSVVVPRFVSLKGSEREIGEFLATSSFNERNIFSFGFEFYGASYYSNRQIYRLADALSAEWQLGSKPQVTTGSVALIFDRDVPELNRILKVKRLAFETERKFILNGKPISIGVLMSSKGKV